MSRSEPVSPTSSSDEAVLVAERLSALLERRRAASGSRAVVTGTVIGARHSGRLLANLLLTRAYLVDSELQYVLRRQAETGGALGEILLELGLISERDLLDLLAEQLRMDVVDPARLDVDRATLALLPEDDARRHAALAWRRSDGHIDVVVADPTDEDAVRDLMTRLGAPLRLFLATRAGIEAAVDRAYSSAS